MSRLIKKTLILLFLFVLFLGVSVTVTSWIRNVYPSLWGISSAVLSLIFSSLAGVISFSLSACVYALLQKKMSIKTYFALNKTTSVPTLWHPQKTSWKREVFSWLFCIASLILMTYVNGWLVQIAPGTVGDFLRRNLQQQQQLALLLGQTSGLTLFLLFLLIAPLTAFAEELFFRGAMVTMLLEETKNEAGALWGIALCFTIAHFNFASFLPILGLSLLLGLLRLRSHSIWPGILLHTLNNSIAIFSYVCFI